MTMEVPNYLEEASDPSPTHHPPDRIFKQTLFALSGAGEAALFYTFNHKGEKHPTQHPKKLFKNGVLDRKSVV